MKYTIPKVDFDVEQVKKQTKEQFVESQPHLTKAGYDLGIEYDKIVGKKPKQLNEGNDKRPVE